MKKYPLTASTTADLQDEYKEQPLCSDFVAWEDTHKSITMTELTIPFVGGCQKKEDQVSGSPSKQWTTLMKKSKATSFIYLLIYEVIRTRHHDQRPMSKQHLLRMSALLLA